MLKWFIYLFLPFVFLTHSTVVLGDTSIPVELSDVFEDVGEVDTDSTPKEAQCQLHFSIFDFQRFNTSQAAFNFCNSWFQRGFNRDTCFNYQVHGGQWESRFRYGQIFDGRGRGYGRNAIFSDLFEFLERRRLWTVGSNFPFNFQFRGC